MIRMKKLFKGFATVAMKKENAKSMNLCDRCQYIALIDT